MKLTALSAALALALATVAGAQTATPDHSAHHPASAAAAAAPMADGEVRKVDKAQGKVTLKHGPIASLDMPGMTMVFKVADAKLLDAIKQGDKVKFAAVSAGGTYTVTAIEVAQ
jgi:Cu(I)/Ag(I) efflux system protein CusF